jgi:hypothetical protein
VPLVGEVLVIGPALVIEIVEQRGEAPGFFVSAGVASVGADTCFDGEHMFAEAFRGSVLAEKFPGVIARGHAVLPVKSG